MRVTCTADSGRMVPGYEVRCEKCGHSVLVPGMGKSAIDRACVMLRESCPNDEGNFYEGPDIA